MHARTIKKKLKIKINQKVTEYRRDWMFPFNWKVRISKKSFTYLTNCPHLFLSLLMNFCIFSKPLKHVKMVVACTVAPWNLAITGAYLLSDTLLRWKNYIYSVKRVRYVANLCIHASGLLFGRFEDNFLRKYILIIA